MANWPKWSVETFNDSIEEKFKISELKEKFNIEVSKKELQEYKDTAFTMKEVQKIQEWISSVSELAKAKLDILKKRIQANETVQKSQDYLSETIKKWEKLQEQSKEQAKDILWKLEDSEIWEKTKKLASKTKDVVKNIWGMTWFVESLKAMEAKWGLMWIFATVMLFILNIFWFWKKIEKAKEIKEKVTEALSTDQIETTKNNIKTTLLKTFPGKEEYIDNILSDPKKLTTGKIQYFYEKIKSWEWITLNDLTKEFKDLEINKLLSEKADEYKKTLYSKVQKDLENKYGKVLTTEQSQDLWKLISKYLTIDGSNIEKIQSRINVDHELQIKDIIPLMLEWGKNSVWFMFWLLSANIISIGDIAMNFAEKWWEVITLSLSALWLSEVISIDDLYENISEMEEKDKAILVALLYRKGWLFLNILWSISALSSKLLIETILPTNSWVDWIKLLKDSLLHWNVKQIENFTKIEKALSASKETVQWTKFLKEALSNLAEVKKNFAILEMMKASNWDINKFYKEVAEFEKATNISLDVKKHPNYSELQNDMSNKMSKKYASKHSFDLRDIKNKWLWFWIESALQDFNRNLEKIWASQARIALWRLNLNPFKKIAESIDISKVSKLWDSLLFELRSPNEAKAFLKQMNELAKKSPELIKGIFDKLPIIAIGWLAASSEKPFFKSLKNELPYLLPIVWPVMMISDAWVDWKTMPPTFMKAEQAAIAWWLLTLDWYFLAKAWFKWAPWYILKPIKDIYDIWKGTVTIWQRLYKTGSVLENSQTVKSIFKGALTKTKALKWKIKAIAIIALIWYWTFELALADDNDNELNKYLKNWKLDTQKIKKDSESLSEKEKNDLIKIILIEHNWEKIFENIQYSILNNNTLSIISNNEDYQWLFFINNDTKWILNDLFWINNLKFEYKKSA